MGLLCGEMKLACCRSCFCSNCTYCALPWRASRRVSYRISERTPIGD